MKIQNSPPKPTELSWLRRRLLQLQPAVSSFSLVHLVAGGDSTQLGTWNVNRDAQVEEEAQRLATEVQEAVIGHSEAFSGATQSYAIIAYTEGDKVAGQHTFRRHVPSDGIADQPSDQPTATGVLAQSMRQVEMLSRLMLATISSTIGSLSAENERLAARAERADESTMKALGLIQELMDMKAARQLEEAKVSRTEERKDRLLKTIERTAIPLLEERFASAGPMKRLVESMTPEQVDKLLSSGVFTAEQIGAFGELMGVTAKADAAREERRKEREQEEKGNVTP